METKDLDILIPYKKDNTFELVYCLRSIAKNFPHKRVFIVGDRPEGIKNIVYIPSPQLGNKHQNVRIAVQKAINDPRLSSSFVYFNNDMFIMKKLELLYYYNRGSIMSVVNELMEKQGQNDYIKGMIKAAELLNYAKEPTSFELHIPMLFNKNNLQDIFNEYSNQINTKSSFQFRTFYGNKYVSHSDKIKDVKIKRGTTNHVNLKDVFLSTDDYSFINGVGDILQGKFRYKCVYEI